MCVAAARSPKDTAAREGPVVGREQTHEAGAPRGVFGPRLPQTCLKL